jgi:hypothetical protein
VLQSVMRRSLFLFAVTLQLCGQQAAKNASPPTFPLPSESQWLERRDPGVHDGLSPVLLKAIQKEFQCARCETIGARQVNLGRLGLAAIAWDGGEGQCGATGNCDFYLFYKDTTGIRSIQIDNGWTYAIVKSGTDVPDIVFMANMSGRSGWVQRYSFVHGAFVLSGCDSVELNESIESAYILTPKQVTIKPCQSEGPD